MNKDRTLPKAWESIDSLTDSVDDANNSISLINDNEYKIKYQEIGNIETSMDILEWALTASTGFYKSTNTDNKFTNLPLNALTGAFELEIGSIKENEKYRTLKLKFFNSNDIYVNTNIANDKIWIGWSKLITSHDNISKERGTIDTKEQADVIFNSINMPNDITGFYWVNNFNTCFPNGLRPQPYNRGLLKVHSVDRYIIQTYVPHAQYLDFDNGLYKRIGTKAMDSNAITWHDWSYENQQIISNDNGQVGWVKFIDGTLVQTLRNINISTYNNGTRIAFPIAFVGTPSASVSDNNNAQNFQIQISPSLSDFALWNVEQRIEHMVSIIAIGRWR